MRQPFQARTLSMLVLGLTLACTEPIERDEIESAAIAAAPSASISAFEREHITGDVWHYRLMLELADEPNARIGLHRVVRERAPFRPRRTVAPAMLLHGDFSSFSTNFAPSLADAAAPHGMAVGLAERGIDVWGIDRRWALAAPAADLSDFGQQGLEQTLSDTQIGLAVARALRLLTHSGAGKFHLAGFSRGGVIAYAYTAMEAALPRWQRHVKGLIPLDVWAKPGPDDELARSSLCEGAEIEYDLVANGVVDSENSFLITVGQLALTAPDEPSPIFGPQTNRGAMLTVAGQTYQVFAPTEFYHLSAPLLESGSVTALRESSEDAISRWFANAAPHQSMLEVADTDAAQCDDGSGPVSIDLAEIEVPLFYLGAGGGYGDHGVHSTTQVSSADVSTLVIRRFDDAGAFEDFGHGDLLFGADAPDLAWQPLAEWLASH